MGIAMKIASWCVRIESAIKNPAKIAFVGVDWSLKEEIITRLQSPKAKENIYASASVEYRQYVNEDPRKAPAKAEDDGLSPHTLRSLIKSHIPREPDKELIIARNSIALIAGKTLTINP